MGKLLTSKKKKENGTWIYRGFEINKSADGLPWVIISSPIENILYKQGTTIKVVCLYIDEQLGALTELEKSITIAKTKDKIKKAVKKPKTAEEKARYGEHTAVLFAKMNKDLNAYLSFKEIKGNSVLYKWNEKSKTASINFEIKKLYALELSEQGLLEATQDIKERFDDLTFDNVTKKLEVLVDKYQGSNRNFKIKSFIKDETNILKLTFVE